MVGFSPEPFKFRQPHSKPDMMRPSNQIQSAGQGGCVRMLCLVDEKHGIQKVEDFWPKGMNGLVQLACGCRRVEESSGTDWQTPAPAWKPRAICIICKRVCWKEN